MHICYCHRLATTTMQWSTCFCAYSDIAAVIITYTYMKVERDIIITLNNSYECCDNISWLSEPLQYLGT